MIRALLACGALLLAAGAAAQSDAGDVRAYDHKRYGKAIGDIVGELANEDFQALERRYRLYLDSGARSTDGTWMVQAFQPVLETNFSASPPGRIEKLFRDWRAHDPGSTLRPIAEALAWQQRAWLAKGSGCYAARPSSARKAFNALVDRAAAALREDEARGKSSPLWHIVAMRVAGAQGRPAAALDALLDEADRRFPAYEPLYAARMEFLLPEWGGDYDAVDRFVRESARKTRDVEGNAFYAWLYLELAAGPSCAGHFDRSKVAWPEMKSGFEDMLERHPDVWNRNVYATFACRARDVDTTRRLLGELGAQANLGAASSSISNASCYRMIQPTAPPQTVSFR